MSEYKIQINTSLGDYLINVNGMSAEEVATHISEFAELSPQLLENLNAIKQAGFVTEAFAKNKIPAEPGVPPATGTPSCNHGVMQDLQGSTTVQGKPYKHRYYCSADRNAPDKCAPKD